MLRIPVTTSWSCLDTISLTSQPLSCTSHARVISPILWVTSYGLQVLSNSSLCLQFLRGRLPELVQDLRACCEGRCGKLGSQRAKPTKILWFGKVIVENSFELCSTWRSWMVMVENSLTKLLEGDVPNSCHEDLYHLIHLESWAHQQWTTCSTAKPWRSPLPLSNPPKHWSINGVHPPMPSWIHVDSVVFWNHFAVPLWNPNSFWGLAHVLTPGHVRNTLKATLFCFVLNKLTIRQCSFAEEPNHGRAKCLPTILMGVSKVLKPWRDPKMVGCPTKKNIWWRTINYQRWWGIPIVSHSYSSYQQQ